MKLLIIAIAVVVIITKSWCLLGGELDGFSVSCYQDDWGGLGHHLKGSDDPFIIRDEESSSAVEDEKDSRRPIIGMMFDKNGSKMTKFLNIRIPLPIRKSFLFKIVPSPSLENRGAGRSSEKPVEEGDNNLWLAKRKFSMWKRNHRDKENIGKIRSFERSYRTGNEDTDTCKVKVSQSTIIVFPNRTVLSNFGKLVRPLSHCSRTENISGGRVFSVPMKNTEKIDSSTIQRLVIYPGKFLEKTPPPEMWSILNDSATDEPSRDGGRKLENGENKTQVFSTESSERKFVNRPGSSTVQSPEEREGIRLTEAGRSQQTDEERVDDLSSTIPGWDALRNQTDEAGSGSERNKTGLHPVVSAVPPLKIIETIRKWLLDTERKSPSPNPPASTTVSWPPTRMTNSSRMGLPDSPENGTDENCPNHQATKHKSVAADGVEISPASQNKNGANLKCLNEAHHNSSMVGSQQGGWKGLVKDLMGGLNSPKFTSTKRTPGNPSKHQSTSTQQSLLLQQPPLEEGLKTPSGSSTTSKKFFMGLFKKSTTSTPTTQRAKVPTPILETKLDKFDKYLIMNNLTTKSVFVESQSLAFDQENEHEPEDISDPTTTLYPDNFFDLSSRKDPSVELPEGMDWRNKQSGEAVDPPKPGALHLADTVRKSPLNRKKLPEGLTNGGWDCSGDENGKIEMENGKTQVERFELISEKYSVNLKNVGFNSSTETGLDGKSSTRQALSGEEKEGTSGNLVNVMSNQPEQKVQGDFFSTTLEINPDERTWTLFDFHDVAVSRQNASPSRGSRDWVTALDQAILDAVERLNGSSMEMGSNRQDQHEQELSVVSQPLKNKVIKVSPTPTLPRLMTAVNPDRIGEIEMTESSDRLGKIQATENSNRIGEIRVTENSDLVAQNRTIENIDDIAEVEVAMNNVPLSKILDSTSSKLYLYAKPTNGSIVWTLTTEVGRMPSWTDLYPVKPVESLPPTPTKKAYKDFGPVPLSWRIDEGTFPSCYLMSNSHSKEGNGTMGGQRGVEIPEFLTMNRFNIFFSLRNSDYYEPFSNKGEPFQSQSSPRSTLDEEIPSESWEEIQRNKVKRPVFGVVPKQWSSLDKKETTSLKKGDNPTTVHLEVGKELKTKSGKSRNSSLPLLSPSSHPSISHQSRQREEDDFSCEASPFQPRVLKMFKLRKECFCHEPAPNET